MKLPIPPAALRQHVIVLGKTRAGKSSKLRVLVEYALDHEIPVTILTPKPDWWGLRSSADGKKAAYPIVIFGGSGPHTDVQINAQSGAHIAELVATGNRPALIDVSELRVGERARFFVSFAETFFKMSKGDRILVIDEVHNFAPQGKILDPLSGEMLHWANRLASEGAGMGITLLAASQRPQKVHKDFITNFETLIACRVLHKLDRAALTEWIDGCADPAKAPEMLRELATMPRTDAWSWSPEIDFGPKRTTWPMFRTYDSFDSRKSRPTTKLRGWANVDLDDVRVKLDAVIKEAQEKDPVALRRRIADLEKQLKQKPAAAVEHVVDTKAIADRAYGQGRTAGVTECQRGFKQLLKALHLSMDKAVGTTFDESFAEAAAIGVVSGPVSAPAQIVSRKAPIVSPKAPIVSSSPENRFREAVDGLLPKGEALILRACIQHSAGVSRDALTVLTGYKRSSRDEYINRLRAKLYVTTAGNTVFSTPEGRAAMPDAEPLPSGDKLLEFWRNKLPQGERKILEILITAFPDAVYREDLNAAGFKRSSRDEYINRLCSRQLATKETTGIRASSNLFSEFINQSS